MHVPTLIEKKREGGELSAEEIAYLIGGLTDGEIPDCQISAWAMAVFFHGMTVTETRNLTAALTESGSVLQYPSGSPRRIGHYSMAGAGDKTSLLLAPLLACHKAWVPMMCGRSLGLADTLEKMECIPGFNVHLVERRALAQLKSIGLFLIGRDENNCPAEQRLHSLRHLTGTVPAQSLVATSILSTKLSENLNRLVVDVKFGSGALIKKRNEARQLATLMAKVGKLLGVKLSYLLSPTEEPLGRTVGCALEVAECVDILQGRGPADTITRVLDLAEKVSPVSRGTLATWLTDGTAWRKFISLVYAQDGDASALEKITDLHPAPIVHPIAARKGGTVSRMHAETIERAAILLGCGRAKADAPLDFATGLSGIKKVGETIASGEPLMFVHARTDQSLRAVLPLLDAAIAIDTP